MRKGCDIDPILEGRRAPDVCQTQLKVPEPGFYNAGTQVVTADSVDMANGLPAVTYEQAQAMAADPAATAAYYKAWSQALTADSLAKAKQPIAAESE